MRSVRILRGCSTYHADMKDDPKRGVNVWSLVSMALILVALVGLVWLLPLGIQGSLSNDPALRVSDVSALNGLRTAIAGVILGTGALGTFWINARNQRTTDNTYRLALRGQLTERYSKCVEQLGSESPEVRIGGLYGLEQFATESASDTDQSLVVEILSSFVRSRTPRAKNKQGDKKPILAEVQVALTILGRLPFRLGLPRADLRDSVLYQAELSNVNLREARLDNADLRGADFGHGRFRDANLTDALLSDKDHPADFFAAEFSNADLGGAKISHARLFSANFNRATLSGVDFSNSALAASSFEGANIAGISQFDVTELLLDGPKAAAQRQWGPPNFKGADLRGVQGIHWAALRKCEIDESTRLDGVLLKARRSETQHDDTT